MKEFVCLTNMKWIFILLLTVSNCSSGTLEQPAPEAEQDTSPIRAERIHGISLTASSRVMSEEVFQSIKKTHANYVCLLPFAFMRSNEPRVRFNTAHQWWGERPEGIAACAAYAHRNGLNVMVKPQIWMHNAFTGDIKFEREEDWKQFEETYSQYILGMLRLADSVHAELFCLGTELDSFVKLRPAYWSNLIDSARKIFNGQLTYAENWDCYHDFPFWSKLDYIGINAYFPLSDEATPSAETLSKSWKQYGAAMKALSQKSERPVLFTEFGYRSVDYCAREPWDAYSASGTNMKAQSSAYESLFKECWSQPWMAGGFCWKWFDANTEPDVSHETDYTPQGKPAEAVLRAWYAVDRN